MTMLPGERVLSPCHCYSWAKILSENRYIKNKTRLAKWMSVGSSYHQDFLEMLYVKDPPWDGEDVGPLP